MENNVILTPTSIGNANTKAQCNIADRRNAKPQILTTWYKQLNITRAAQQKASTTPTAISQQTHDSRTAINHKNHQQASTTTRHATPPFNHAYNNNNNNNNNNNRNRNHKPATMHTTTPLPTQPTQPHICNPAAPASRSDMA